jgi:hypothetical protein
MSRFGRRVEFDERSRGYPARAALRAAEAPATRVWDCQTYLDQGDDGACVGFGWAHEVNADPAVPSPPLGYLDAMGIYFAAQLVDEWPGEDYEGTSVLAGAKVVQRRGYMAEYRWAFGLGDALLAISQLGPVVLGVNWYESMMDVNDAGWLRVYGGVAGGHALLARGVDVAERSVLLHNSWGESWGVGGTAKLSWDDLDRLLHESGEACVPLARALPDGPPPDPEPAEPGCLPRWLARLAR